MLISDVARRSGVPAKTLRYYEEIGLIEPPARSPSGYRDYDESVLDRLRFIRSAQALGLTLGEIRSVIALREGGETPCGRVLELLRDRAADIDRTIRELRALKADLNQLVSRAEHLSPSDCDPRGICHLIGATN
jgi:DNA-binding transcriptional MerR regulator